MQNFAIIVVPAFADCPAHYLADILSLTPTTNAVNRHTTDPARAMLFPTREEASAVLRSLDGMLWPHAEIEAREVQPSLLTPAGRIEVRDIATGYWHEFAEQVEEGDIVPSESRTVDARLHFVRSSLSLDFGAKVVGQTIEVTDCDGWTLTLDFDPSTDGFEYPTSGDDALALSEGRGHEYAGELSESAVADGCLVPPSEPMRQFCDGCERLTPVEDIVESGNADIGYYGYCSACRASHAR